MNNRGSELIELIEGHLADRLGVAGQRRLVAMLRADESARKTYLEFMDLNAELLWSMQSRRGTELAIEPFGLCKSEPAAREEPAAAPPLVFDVDDATIDTPPGAVNLLARPWNFALGGGLLFAMVALIAFGGSLFVSRKEAQPLVALKPMETISVTAPSLLQLESGMARLILPKVGYVILDGPAEFHLLGEKRARLTSGRIKFRVTEPTGRGFVVETPYGEITDLGTEFGIDLTEHGKAGLVVFEGSVDLRVGDSLTPGRVERLVGGEGVVIHRGGQLDRLGSIVSRDDATFVRPSGSGAIDPESSVIADVTDNVDTGRTKKFYEIVPRGMREDAMAYVDRPAHEWNGVDRSGMPSYLLGADYVKTFNDDKLLTDVEISVTLTQPAALYVFLDIRVPHPEWLRRDFEETGDRVGLDNGPMYDQRRKRSVNYGRGVGPGKSIDEVFTVWKRVIRSPGVVKLGPNAGVTWESGMYGVAAAPLTAEDLEDGDSAVGVAPARSSRLMTTPKGDSAKLLFGQRTAFGSN